MEGATDALPEAFVKNLAKARRGARRRRVHSLKNILSPHARARLLEAPPAIVPENEAATPGISRNSRLSKSFFFGLNRVLSTRHRSETGASAAPRDAQCLPELLLGGGRCKLDPGLKAPAFKSSTSSTIMKRKIALNLHLVLPLSFAPLHHGA